MSALRAVVLLAVAGLPVAAALVAIGWSSARQMRLQSRSRSQEHDSSTLTRIRAENMEVTREILFGRWASTQMARDRSEHPKGVMASRRVRSVGPETGLGNTRDGGSPWSRQ
jgi:photosystem II stability/assembly factor-like uncharacterized protein